MRENIFPVRMRFSKIERARYISHLDLMRCFQRAVCRANLPVAYSNGFHPRMQLSFATTLSLGYSSTAEIMQLDFTQPLDYTEVQSRLNAVLPQGIQILETGAPVFPFPQLAFADYHITLKTADPKKAFSTLQECLAMPHLLVEKKGKKGIKTVDIRPGISLYQATCFSDRLDLQMRFPAGNTAVNPILFLNLLDKSEEIFTKNPEICRTQLWKSENEKFF